MLLIVLHFSHKQNEWPGELYRQNKYNTEVLKILSITTFEARVAQWSSN